MRSYPFRSLHASKMQGHFLKAKLVINRQYSRNVFSFIIKFGNFFLFNQVRPMPPSSLGKIKQTVGKFNFSPQRIHVPLNTILPLRKVGCLPYYTHLRCSLKVLGHPWGIKSNNNLTFQRLWWLFLIWTQCGVNFKLKSVLTEFEANWNLDHEQWRWLI